MTFVKKQGGLFFHLYLLIVCLKLCWFFVAVLSLVAASTGSFLAVGHRLRVELASLPAEHGFSSCGSWVYLPHSLWDLPGPGIEPAAPPLAVGFLTTRPRKSSGSLDWSWDEFGILKEAVQDRTVKLLFPTETFIKWCDMKPLFKFIVSRHSFTFLGEVHSEQFFKSCKPETEK